MRGLSFIWLAFLPFAAEAHPVDSVAQVAYLTLGPGVIQIELDVTPGREVAKAVLAGLDANGDGIIAKDEARAFGQMVLDQTQLRVDGTAVRWSRFDVGVPDDALLASGNATISIVGMVATQDSAAAHSLTFRNDYAPAKSLWTANVFLQDDDLWRYEITAQKHDNDGRTLSVQYTTAHP